MDAIINRLDLVNQTDAGDILGVTRQRVEQLKRESKDFPEPVYAKDRTFLWRRDDIRRWGRDAGYLKRY